jgi:glycosyltransferase involved in cell wall biosynthesis
VGIIAALRPEKDHETFLRAAAFLSARVPNARFLLIGDGPRRSLLENLAREIGLSSNVDFLGWQRVDSNLLGRLDVLTLSSFSETFPAVIIEAFSAGIPVVATDVGSVSELFGSPPCGILVSPQDPRALADALLMLTEDKQLYTTISQRALERAKFFSGDRFCGDILQLTRNLLQKKARTSSPA